MHRRTLRPAILQIPQRGRAGRALQCGEGRSRAAHLPRPAARDTGRSNRWFGHRGRRGTEGILRRKQGGGQQGEQPLLDIQPAVHQRAALSRRRGGRRVGAGRGDGGDAEIHEPAHRTRGTTLLHLLVGDGERHRPHQLARHRGRHDADHGATDGGHSDRRGGRHGHDHQRGRGVQQAGADVRRGEHRELDRESAGRRPAEKPLLEQAEIHDRIQQRRRGKQRHRRFRRDDTRQRDDLRGGAHHGLVHTGDGQRPVGVSRQGRKPRGEILLGGHQPARPAQHVPLATGSLHRGTGKGGDEDRRQGQLAHIEGGHDQLPGGERERQRQGRRGDGIPQRHVAEGRHPLRRVQWRRERRRVFAHGR